MATQESQSAGSGRPGRWLFRLGWLLLILGPALYAVQLLALKQLVVPWYVPLLATGGVLAMLLGTWKKFTVWRLLGVAGCLLLLAMEWSFLLAFTRAPAYAGPTAGQALPAFAAVRADGAAFTDRDLIGTPTVLLFFRGHW